MITIAVFMYNEERYILDTLESIRFQVEHYGAGREFQLILLDDCSKDRTAKIADLWTEKNAALFKRIDKLYSEENAGTCQKYADMVRNIRGDKYITIAGDDVFVSHDVFAEMEEYECDILMTPVLKFKDYRVFHGLKHYLDTVAQSLVTVKSISWESKLGSPVLNGALYDLQLLSEDVLNFMCRYRLLEDRARVYKIVSDNKKIKINYINSPLLLSRKQDNSVSGLKSPHLKTHNEDLYNLFKDIYDEESNGLMRWALKCQMRAARYRGQKGVKARLARITPYYARIGMRLAFHWPKVKRLYNKLMENYAEKNEKYLEEIHSAAVAFANSYGIIFEN